MHPTDSESSRDESVGRKEGQLLGEATCSLSGDVHTREWAPLQRHCHWSLSHSQSLVFMPWMGSDPSQVRRLPCGTCFRGLSARISGLVQPSLPPLGLSWEAGKDWIQHFTPCFLLQKLGMSSSLWAPGFQACTGRSGWRLGGLSKAPQPPPQHNPRVSFSETFGARPP